MSADRLAWRLRRPAPLPHEWLAIVFVLAGVYLLETLPVTYPRSALFLAYAVPVALMSCVSLVTMLLVRRRLSRAESIDRLAWIVRSSALLALVMPVHFLLKSFIYLINPNVWDARLLEIDRWLLFGRSPSIFLIHLFLQPAFLRFLDFVYSGLYYLILVFHVGTLMVLPPLRERLAFVASYSTLWIVGMVLYLSFPSWGPVFVWPDIFEECLAYMPRTVSVQYVLYGEISSLVRDPLGTRVIRFGCVAAFPSLHLAVVTLFALASRSTSRVWASCNLGFVVLMFIGSVVTGYHYLIDSVVGIVIGAALWFLWRRVYGTEKSPFDEEPSLQETNPEGV